MTRVKKKDIWMKSMMTHEFYNHESNNYMNSHMDEK